MTTPTTETLAATPPRQTRRLLLGFAWSGLAVLLFSGWLIVTRYSVTQDLRVWDIMALRFGGGALVLLPFVLRNGHRPPARGWLEGLLLALLWGVPFVLCVAEALKLASASEASATTPCLMPVFAGLLAWLLFGERPGRFRLVGYAIIVAGLATLLTGHDLGGGRLLGIGLLMLAALLWAIYTLRFRRSGLTPLQAAAGICLWSSLLYLPVYLALGLSRLGSVGWAELTVQIVYQGLLMSGVAIVCFNRAVALLGPVAAAAIIALIPVSATLMAIPALGEVPSAGNALAIAVIAAGVACAARPTPAVRRTA